MPIIWNYGWGSLPTLPCLNLNKLLYYSFAGFKSAIKIYLPRSPLSKFLPVHKADGCFLLTPRLSQFRYAADPEPFTDICKPSSLSRLFFLLLYLPD